MIRKHKNFSGFGRYAVANAPLPRFARSLGFDNDNEKKRKIRTRYCEHCTCHNYISVDISLFRRDKYQCDAPSNWNYFNCYFGMV